jgi:hypothetical protein
VTDCALCEQGVSHCHGTLVVLSYSDVACTDPECRELDIERHELVQQEEEVNRP